ncbi:MULTISPECIES: hypothetical protein [Microbacterium]|uniref:hypothetical protein n=1 Tax=Microbacterium TaxID=33882 RepID=UPI00034D6D76|nr:MULTISPECIES: hypothetical protein [Microbacterium]EYT58880.1 hypothetical protein D514_0108505 [Microbacterium sp. UCD-TDU]MBP5803086.1 hypothetical protein [Microbacterium liquefaciens]
MSTDLPEAEPEDEVFGDDDGVLYDEEVTPEFGILGFTLRELLIVGVWLLSFVFSFFPLIGDLSLWSVGIQWVLPVALPTVAVFLLVLRRFSPEGIRRVGSLGIDQFASVAFSVSATVWAGSLWLAISAAVSTGNWSFPWNGVAMVITSLALVVLTVFAPIIPGLKEDFHGRLVTLAHRNANPVRPVIARPRPEPVPVPEASEGSVETSVAAASSAAPEAHAESPTGVIADGSASPLVVALDDEASGQQATDEIARFDLAAQVPLTAHASGGGIGTEQASTDEGYVPAYSRRSRGQEPEIVSDTGSIESLLETAATYETGAVEEESAPLLLEGVTDADLEATNPRETAAVAQPFWILAPSERDVHDERGEPLFRIGPNAWALVIEDRGGAFVVRHDDGRIGYLHDISDITKG